MDTKGTLAERLISINNELSRFIQKREDSENGPSKKQVSEQEKESTTKRPNQTATSIW